jgi:copper chaperone CopZ
VSSTLKKVVGIRKIRTDWGNQLITVTYDDQQTTTELIEQAIVKSGHLITDQQ